MVFPILPLKQIYILNDSSRNLLPHNTARDTFTNKYMRVGELAPSSLNTWAWDACD